MRAIFLSTLLFLAPMAHAEAPVPTTKMTEQYIAKMAEFVARGFKTERLVISLRDWFGQDFDAVRDGQGRIDIINIVRRDDVIIYYNTIGTLPAPD